ncbi:MAG TPA: hypothetical protein VF530_13680 [Planctomycetota bacterium]
MSSPTVALLRRDLPWLLGFLLLGSGLAALVLGDAGVAEIFVVPSKSLAEQYELTLGPCAVLLALATSLGEALRGTRDLARHRPVAPERAFLVRHIAAVVVLTAWTALGLLAPWAAELWSGANGACVDASRFGALAALSTGLALDYALVVLGLCLPTAWVVRFLAAAILLFLRYAAQSALGHLDPSWGAYLVLCALGTVVALWIAARCEAVGHDPDRPTPARALYPAVAVGGLAAAAFGAIAATGWHELAFTALSGGRPMLARLGEDEVGLLADPDDEQRWMVLDERGRPSGRRVPLHGTDHKLAPRPTRADFDALSVPVLHPPFAWYQSRAGEPVTRRVVIQEDALRVVELGPELAQRACWTLPLPAGTTRARGAGFLELRDGAEEPLFFLAPEVGLWLVHDETPPRLEFQPPPSPERPLRLDYGRDAAGETQRLLATGNRLWSYRSGAWEPFGAAEPPRTSFTVLDDDPLRPEVEIRLAGGATLRHRFELASAREWLCAGFAVAATILRPLPLALLGATTDYAEIARTRPDEALMPLDPLLGGGHAWLLLPNLALTALCVAVLVRDLRRRGLRTPRIVAWSLAVLVAGVFAGPVLLALEPRRAWLRPARTAPPTPLLIAA